MKRELLSIEVPRLVKKPGGERKRVNTHLELADALADGWLIRLEDASVEAEPEPETEAEFEGAETRGRSTKKK